MNKKYLLEDESYNGYYDYFIRCLNKVLSATPFEINDVPVFTDLTIQNSSLKNSQKIFNRHNIISKDSRWQKDLKETDEYKKVINSDNFVSYKQGLLFLNIHLINLKDVEIKLLNIIDESEDYKIGQYEVIFFSQYPFSGRIIDVENIIATIKTTYLNNEYPIKHELLEAQESETQYYYDFVNKKLLLLKEINENKEFKLKLTLESMFNTPLYYDGQNAIVSELDSVSLKKTISNLGLPEEYIINNVNLLHAISSNSILDSTVNNSITELEEFINLAKEDYDDVNDYMRDHLYEGLFYPYTFCKNTLNIEDISIKKIKSDVSQDYYHKSELAKLQVNIFYKDKTKETWIVDISMSYLKCDKDDFRPYQVDIKNMEQKSMISSDNVLFTYNEYNENKELEKQYFFIKEPKNAVLVKYKNNELKQFTSLSECLTNP